MICPGCGREIDDNSAFCPFCRTDVLNNGFININNLTDELIYLRSEVKRTFTFAILSIVFAGYIGLFIAVWTLSKISFVHRTALLPRNVDKLDEYERLKNKLGTSRVLCIIGIILSSVWIIISPYIMLALNEALNLI